MRKLTAVLTALGALGGCASHPDQIGATYVPASTYASLSCAEVSKEMDRVKARLAAASGDQEAHANLDAAWVGASLFVWPALIMTTQGEDRRDEIASLRGHWDALYANYRDRECVFQEQAQKPPPAT